MTTLKNLERQHHDIYALIHDTKALIASGKFDEKGSDIARNISVLAGKLKIHLSNEDKYLYPSLVDKGDSRLKSKAESYMSEMGGLSKTYMIFKDKYNTRSKIMSDSATFISESTVVFEAVLKRMHKEDTDLYQLAKDHIK